MKLLFAIFATVFSSFSLATQILVDDFSQRANPPWWTNADPAVNTGSMLGGYRYTEAYGGLTPVTEHGVQTGNSWRERGSNTGNSWGLATNGQNVVELNLALGAEGGISANFLDVSTGIQIRAEVASYISGYGYGTNYAKWVSPTFTLLAGPQIVNFHFADFLADGNGKHLDPNNVDSIKIWITQQEGIYPAIGKPAYVLDSVYAVSSVPEPTSVTLFLSGLLIFSLKRLNALHDKIEKLACS